MDSRTPSLNPSGVSRVFLSTQRSLKGVSLPELLIVIGAVAVLAAIAIPMINGLLPAASGETAMSNLRLLNRAVIAHNQANSELVLEADPGDADEIYIFGRLKHRDAVNPAPGSPFLKEGVNLVISSDEGDYRASWNGRVFEIVEPGAEGTGLDLLGIARGEQP